MPMQYVVHANLKAPHHHGPGSADILHGKYMQGHLLHNNNTIIINMYDNVTAYTNIPSCSNI